MIQPTWGEIWKEVEFKEDKPRLHYAVSTRGRCVSFKEKREDGKLIRGKLTEGFPVIMVTLAHKRKSLLLHRLVAQTFIGPAPSPEHRIIHLDYNKENNSPANLKWVDKAEWEEHQNHNPKVIATREAQKDKKPYQGHKLNATRVALLKKKLFDPERKTRLKLLARQFGISEMQLYRIKTGENWSHVMPAH